MSEARLHETGDLLALALSGSTGPHALEAEPWILWSGQVDGLDPAHSDLLGRWIARCTCPVISVGAANPMADLWVQSEDQLGPLLRNIERTPIAATVLMQVLRHDDKDSIEAGLHRESLAYASLQGSHEFQTWLSTYSPTPPAQQIDPGPAVQVHRAPEVLRLHLNRPSRRNALSVEMRDALLESLTIAIADPEIQQIHLAGRGQCFSTGGDLDEFGQFPNVAVAHLVRSTALPARALAECAQRVTAYLHGACVGSGIEIPAFAHRVLAHRKSWFQLPELKYGLIPGAGGCVSIARRIGRQRMARWVLSGKRIDAATALEWGLIDEIVDSP